MVNDSMLTRRAREASKSSKRNSDVELVIPKFTFVPFNRTYTYVTETVLSRTIFVASINLRAGVRPNVLAVNRTRRLSVGTSLRMAVVHVEPSRIQWEVVARDG